MPALTLGYRHCDRKRPLYIKNAEIEAIAALARQQLVDADTDAIPREVLCDISALSINGITFDLFVGTGHVVHDEDGNPVLGICEYDPGVPQTAMVSVTPAGEHASEGLVLSTLGHELGHAIFDAPGWIFDASLGPGLFDEPDHGVRRAYRTTTRDLEHLSRPSPVIDTNPPHAALLFGQTPRDLYFAELRANEFMGSLLVPRHRLNVLVAELAPMFDVEIRRSPSFDPEWAEHGLNLTVEAHDAASMECLQQEIANQFGVNRRFIAVRMERYGLIKPENKAR